MEWVTISVGGSLICPDEKIDYSFLKSFKKVIDSFQQQYKFAICTGGGNIARVYIAALRKQKCNKQQQDEIGILCTQLNAQLLTFYFRLPDKIPLSIQEVIQRSKRSHIVIFGGLWPGTTSDGTAAEIGRQLGSKLFINITNVSGLFDKNPKKYPHAKLIRKISHEDFNVQVRKIKEMPGQHFVLDRKAAQLTFQAGMRVIILGGLENLKRVLEKKSFVGTVIS